jgi:hypothetical protein
MPGENWVEKVKQYRLAVDAYCDAVDHTHSGLDLSRQWQQIEAARAEAERARTALLQDRRVSVLAAMSSWAHSEMSDQGTEEWVLGDVGQHGG